MKLPASILLFSIIWLLFVCTVLAAEKRGSNLKPPMAKVKPKKLENHGHVRTDNYYWLKERENPEVIDYLNAENDYTDAVMAHTRGLQDELFEEIKGRIKQDDSSVPYKLDDYFYYSRYETGKEYTLYCRKKGSLEGAEEIMLNVNKMAEGHDFFVVKGLTISWNQNMLAFAADTVGRRIYAVQFKNLTTGEILPDMIPAVTGNMAWANDNKTLFYAKQDPATLRSFQIYKHILGTDSATDQLVYEEKDDTFSCHVSRTKSKKYIVIGSSQTLSNEYRYLDANNPDGEFSVFLPREREHEYKIDHYGDYFYIRTNLNAKNFRLMKTQVTKTTKENWQEVIAHRDDVFLKNFEIFKDHLVLGERKNGLRQIRVISWDGSDDHYLDFGEPTYLAYINTNRDFNTITLRYGYQSMTTPNSIYDYDMLTKKKVLLKQDEVLGDFSSENYVTERLYATAHDGAKVPISIVYRKGLMLIR